MMFLHSRLLILLTLFGVLTAITVVDQAKWRLG